MARRWPGRRCPVEIKLQHRFESPMWKDMLTKTFPTDGAAPKAGQRDAHELRLDCATVAFITATKYIGVIMSHITTGVEYGLHCLLYLVHPLDQGRTASVTSERQ